jgi:hypothetical protein
MNVIHLDIAQRAFEASGLPPTPPYRSVEDALRYITLLLGMLPPEEHAGYVGKGGDNIAALPDGTTVSVSRIGYPDGHLYKVMSDAPNGSSQWVDNGQRPSDQTYVPFTGQRAEPTAPVPPGPNVLEPRVRQLEEEVDGLQALHAEVLRQLTDLNEGFKAHADQIAALNQESRDGHVHPVGLFARKTGLPRQP